MHIVVCIKQVPDPQAPAGSFYVDEAANEPRWSPPAENLISTFDLHALEAAAQIKDEHGATVTVISLGSPDVEVALRRALAAGGDAAIRLDTDAAPDGDRLAVARALAAAVRKLGPVDLVLAGRIAVDWDMGHVPMMLSELLGVASATPVVGLVPGDGRIVVKRLTDDGHQVIELPLPCLLAVSNEINEPRYPTMRSVLDAQRKPVATWTATDLGLEDVNGPGVSMVRLIGRDLSRACELVEGSTQEEAGELLADLLEARGLV
jgi:electron transfer flavoprotein beta subunit